MLGLEAFADAGSHRRAAAGANRVLLAVRRSNEPRCLHRWQQRLRQGFGASEERHDDVAGDETGRLEVEAQRTIAREFGPFGARLTFLSIRGDGAACLSFSSTIATASAV